MSRTYIVAASILAAVVVATGAAASPPSKPAPAQAPLPAPLAERIAGMVRDCKASGGTPDTATAVIRTDVDHDGLTDFIFWEGNVGCTGNDALFAPTAQHGLWAAIYAGQKSGPPRRVWVDDNIWDLSFKDGRIIVAAGGVACGDFQTNVPGHEVAQCKREVVAENGVWKNIPADDGQAMDQTAATDQAQAQSAPQATAWGYGDTLPLVQPGGPCQQGAQLLKGYCFGEAIAYLRSHPTVGTLRVVAVTAPVGVGTFVGAGTPVGYVWVDVKRQGNGFSAEKHSQGTTRTRAPSGCLSGSAVAQGFQIVPGGALEATQYACDPAY